MVVKELQFASQPNTNTQWVTYNTIEDNTTKHITLNLTKYKEEKSKLDLTPREYINKLINNG